MAYEVDNVFYIYNGQICKNLNVVWRQLKKVLNLPYLDSDFCWQGKSRDSIQALKDALKLEEVVEVTQADSLISTKLLNIWNLVEEGKMAKSLNVMRRYLGLSHKVESKNKPGTYWRVAYGKEYRFHSKLYSRHYDAYQYAMNHGFGPKRLQQVSIVVEAEEDVS